MKNLKLLIIILIMLAIGLLGVIILIGLQNNDNRNNVVVGNIQNNNNIANNSTGKYQEGEAPELTFNTEIQQVTDNSILYSISNNINKYFNYIKDGNTVAVNELGGNTIYSISNTAKYVVKQAFSTENGYQNKYYTYGILSVANGDFTANDFEAYMIMYVDKQNNTYKLETVNQAQVSNMIALNQDEDIEISKGTYNNFEYEHIDNVKQMEIYLEDYSFQIFNNTEKAYNLLSKDYQNRRFGNIENFIKYLNEKQATLVNIEITQYNFEEEDEYNLYKGTDKYGNYYHIIETAYMEYTVILDNYTMQDYSNSSTEEKIEKSAEKFILMVNSADYTNAYNLLEPTFKATYFPTEQDFINYVKNNWYERNIITSKKVIDEGICNVVIKETIATTSSKMEKQFKVTLGEGMQFTIEFNV